MKILFKAFIYLIIGFLLVLVVDVKTKNKTDVELCNNIDSNINSFLALLGIIITLQSL